MNAPLPGVLSIQSQVVYGHVGNSAAQFALQRLGVSVWALPTVLFSNHPGHGGFTGRALPAEDLATLIDGLAGRGILNGLQAILSGYLGAGDQARVVADAVAKARAAAPDLLYCCDPVIGDEGKGAYVQPGVADALCNTLLPLADLAKPNAFELAWLTGKPVEDPASAATAARALGVPLVIVSSVPMPPDNRAIGAMAVTAHEAWLVSAPRLAAPPPGTGDLFTALILGHLLTGQSSPDALARAASSLDHLLDNHARQTDGPDLPLIAGQHHLVAEPHLRVVSVV